MANRGKACFVFSWVFDSGGLNDVCEPNILHFPTNRFSKYFWRGLSFWEQIWVVSRSKFRVLVW